MSASPYRETDILRLFANVAAAATDEVIQSALAGRRLRVVQADFVAGGTATALTFNTKGSGAGVPISPLFACGANGGAVLPFNPHGYFQTAPGEALTCTTGAGATVGVHVTVAVVGSAVEGYGEVILMEDGMGSEILSEASETLMTEGA